MAERFDNLDNILRHFAKEKFQQSLVDALTGTKAGGRKQTVSFSGNGLEKYSSSLSRQSSEIKSETKLVSKLTLKCPYRQNFYFPI